MKKIISLILAIAVVVIITVSLFSVNCFAIDSDSCTCGKSETTTQNNVVETTTMLPSGSRTCGNSDALTNKSISPFKKTVADCSHEHPLLTWFTFILMFIGLICLMVSIIAIGFCDNEKLGFILQLLGLLIFIVGAILLSILFVL
jgi:hypothetical protein